VHHAEGGELPELVHAVGEVRPDREPHHAGEVERHADEREQERLAADGGEVFAARDHPHAGRGQAHRPPPTATGSSTVGGPLWPRSSPRPSRTTFTKMSSSGRVASANDSIWAPPSSSARSTCCGV